MKEIFSWTKELFKTALDKLLFIFSIIIFILSFTTISYINSKFNFAINYYPNWIMLAFSIIVFIAFIFKTRPSKFEISSVSNSSSGYKLQFGSNHCIQITKGEIQNEVTDEYTAIVLPANNAFDDNCMNDRNSALGSFFLSHFPTGITEIQKQIKTEAMKACGQAKETFKQAPIGTAIYLKNPLGSNFNIIVVAVTSITPEQHIHADTISIVAAIKQIFNLAAQNRLTTVIMPVLGTGHGGLDFKSALSLILIQSMHCMQYEGFHHVRTAKVIVHDPTNQKDDLTRTIVQSINSLT